MKKIICVLFIFAIVILGNKQKKEEIIIPKESIRFRILANSNSIEDQALKLKIKNDIKHNLISDMNTESYLKTEEDIKKNIHKIENTLKKYNVEYNISYGKNYFPEKEYKGLTYPEGDYQSLVITLGKGTGDNWWCVLFPPLCLMESEESNYEDVEYQLYVNKILSKFKS